MMGSGLPLAEKDSEQTAARSRARLNWLWDVLLIAILLLGVYFRFVGVDWDQGQHLHPDERFLTMVETAIAPVHNLAQYFDTANSTLNPHNRGYGFYVYGTLPLIAVRYVGEWLGKTGYDEINLVGRQLSAVMDLGTVVMVYLIATRLFRNRRLSLLAAAFASFSVLPIQLSHYFTVDTFTNFFGMLAFYFAMLLLPARGETGQGAESDEAVPAQKKSQATWLTQEWKSVIPYVLFGAALGMAMACKINAVLLAALLPGAALVRLISQPREEREQWIPIYLRNLFIGAVISFIFFRIFQPYAFTGPGFFGITPNDKWVQNMKDLAAQSTGDVDFPPALQWARRPITFALQNMVIWGLGLPLGILAWVGFLWMAVRIVRSMRDPRGEWNQHLLLWGWTGVYFAYQSYNWTRSMRYQMLVYPTLAIIAAWAVFALWESQRDRRWQSARIPWLKIGAAVVGVGVLTLTFTWAYAFTRIYTRPVTRVAASRWIYQNVPGPINLKIDTGDVKANGQTTQPVAFRSGYELDAQPLMLAFRPRQSGQLVSISFDHLGSLEAETGVKTLSVAIGQSPDDPNPLATASLQDAFIPDSSDPRGKSYTVSFAQPAQLDGNKTYYLTASLPGAQQTLEMAGAIVSTILTESGPINQSLPELVDALHAGKQYRMIFQPVKPGILRQVVLDHVVDWEGRPDLKTLRVTIIDSDGESGLSSGEVKNAFGAPGDIRGEAYTVALAQPVNLQAGRTYTFMVEQVDGPGKLALYGSKQANESSWDDALPLGLDGYNPYDYNQGVYRSDLNFEMYWDDNPDKLNRFLSVLDQADYIFVSSNRQWGTTTRLPERYPLTSEYYRDLLGCPANKEITWCYSMAQPGMFKGTLGFELVSAFQSDPNLGSLRFNSQFAEEAFTVYDAPKVMIFKKTAAYHPDQVQKILGAVDLSTVMHITPRKAASYPNNLMLPATRLAAQTAGGTWADLFHPDALYNRYPGLGAVMWYLVMALLGWTVYPLTRLALHGLPDRGYPFSRLVGLLVLAYPVWLLGSYQVPFSPLTITLVFAGLVLANLGLAYSQRQALLKELRERWKYILLVELLFLGFFLLFLLVRLGNPDLWHQWKGGEKPMDFSYFNAVLKSTTFPPYNPWFAGAYINYYYYGFVLAGVPVKWLGIVPAIAYNLILPMWFAMLALGAFSLGWNLLAATRRRLVSRPGEPVFDDETLFERRGPPLAGLSAALASVVLGNWGTVRMIWYGVQRLADMHGIPFEKASFFTHIAWTFAGLAQLIAHPGTPLPYPPGDWYWIPSRAFTGLDITEFPSFTFLYADPHAHLLALPVTVLALGWALSVLLGRWGWKNWGHLAVSFLLGGLVIGTLKPTNTWDWPTYLAIGCVAVVYTALRYGQACCLQIPGVTPKQKRVIIAVAGVVVLAGLSILLFKPFSDWYGQGYTKFVLWKNYRTPFWSYLTHWGLFLFILVSWMTWETIDWMATTPVSALNKLRPIRDLIWGGVVILAALVIGLLVYGVPIAWLALPLLVWAGVLLLRPNQPDAKRAVLFMTGTALFLTLFVELFALEGDLDRMNTIFKFYLQAWILLAASAGASLIWLLPAVKEAWRPGWRKAWQPALVALIFGAALFPLLAGMDKIRDRMAANAPHTLDGMAYMAYATYQEGNSQLNLSEDYRAIEWMQRNVKGSPVIVEANTPEYRWGTRFTIYTGLPGVVGWNWHQRQQRSVTPDTWVFQRVDAVGEFYNTTTRAQAEDFLQRYAVKYIIVGQLERALYTPDGLQKFANWNGGPWHEVYRDGQTAIYEVAQ